MSTQARDIRRARKAGYVAGLTTAKCPFTSKGMRRAYRAGQRQYIAKRVHTGRGLNLLGKVISDKFGFKPGVARTVVGGIASMFVRRITGGRGPAADAARDVFTGGMQDMVHELVHAQEPATERAKEE